MACEHEQKQVELEVLEPQVPLTPFCSSRTYMGQEDALDEQLVSDTKS